ncbi:hypothetical protein Lalb_Chr15g0089541 [Lupinus albus]|uniref:Uncharacterized protein n=1 Tax=Lupinus albus TaxID=3870 RepID=A0A6A4P3F4_LUPAL|nr:hypothetical protein Lalb_Chr15g0089541 [Lupinus albus]
MCIFFITFKEKTFITFTINHFLTLKVKKNVHISLVNCITDTNFKFFCFLINSITNGLSLTHQLLSLFS